MPLRAKANEVEFYCDTSGSVPITKIHTNRGDEEFILWVQERGGYSVKDRCLEVSKRFNLVISRGKLLLKKDRNFNGSPVICSVSRPGDSCDSNNILVTLSSRKQLNRAFMVFTDFQRSTNNKSRAPIKLSGDSKTPSTVIKASGATGLPPVTATGAGVSPYLTDDGDYFDLGRMVNDWNTPVNSMNK
jgi:Circadian oscillating protein COP23